MSCAYPIHYGEAVLNLSFPDGVSVKEAETSTSSPPMSEAELIETSLMRPLGSIPLEDRLRTAQRIVIISDDNTRPTPVARILPSVLAILEKSRVKDEQVVFLIASGTHRPMKKEELEAKLSVEVLSRFTVVQHDYQDEGNLVSAGFSSQGTPIRVNRIAAEADLVIGIGNIVPHRFCGFSGGAKIIVPGISSAETTAGTHLMVTRYPDIQMGRIENSARTEIEKIAEVFSSFFLINTVLDSDRNILAVFSGDMKKAFRAGARYAQEISAVTVERPCDIVIASAYPNDYNLWQAGKALYTADLAVREGGIIILVSPLTEGIGEHDEFKQLLKCSYEEIEERIREGASPDIIGASAALAISLVRKRAELWIVSDGISDQEAQQMRVRRFSDLQEAVDQALARTSPSPEVLLVHDATEIFLSLDAKES